jgi:hypothetical protein
LVNTVCIDIFDSMALSFQLFMGFAVVLVVLEFARR